MSPETAHYYRPDKSLSSWTKYFIVSLFFHFFVLALIFIVPSGASVKNYAQRPQAIDVSLVSLNTDLSIPRHRDPEPAPRTTGGKQSKDAVDIKPEQEKIPLIKSSLKKKINKTDYVLKLPEADAEPQKPVEPEVKEAPVKSTEPDETAVDAVKRVEEKAASERPRSVQERIKQMKGEVGDLAYNKARLGTDETTGSGGQSTAQDYSQLHVWQAEVQVEMKQNWAFSSELAGDTRGLESRLVIKIMPDGQITDVWFEKRSGNSYLDESAYKTVMKSNPLPPLPESYSKPYYNLVLGFTPSGMK